MAFKITENYVCPDSCSECINRQCCSLDYIMTTAGRCTCNSNLYANCECPIGFEPAHVSITPSLYSCVAETAGELRTEYTVSAVGLPINCSASGNGTAISGTFSAFNYFSPYIRSPSYAAGDICNVTLPYLKRSDLAIAIVAFRSSQENDNYISLYVNDHFCRSGNKLIAIDITDCFQETGIYNLTFRNPVANNAEALAFYIYESYYCLPGCANCLNDKCCPSNFVIENHDCGCEESSLSSCSCPFGYVLHRHADSQSSLYGCHKIDILEDQISNSRNLKENIVVSKSGLDISCSITGLSSTAISTVHSSKNNIAGTDWVWTYNGPVDNDNCNVNIVFFKHSLSNITLQFDGEDVQNFFVNSALCWSGGRGTLTSVSVSECFGLTGFMSLLFSLSTPLVHLACHLSW